jgi:SAM-dependent methyltransferase
VTLAAEAKRWVQAHPALWRTVREVRHGVFGLLPPHPGREGSGRIHRDDSMLRACGGFTPDGIDRYLASGRATANLALDLSAGAIAEPRTRRWLELGCGYGRVTRWLARATGPDNLWAADVDRAAVRFCARELGVHPVVSDKTFHTDVAVVVDATLAVSVLTHLPDAGARAFFTLLDRVSGSGAVVIFTTHGEHSLATLERYEDGRYAPQRSVLERSYRERGSAYVPYGYDRSGGYGMSWHSPDAVRSLLTEVTGSRFAVLEHHPRALDDHQDVWLIRAE